MRGLANKNPEIEITKNTDYLNRSLYGYVLQQFIKYFPRNQIFIVIFEDYIKNPFLVVRNNCNFLGIAYTHPQIIAALNKSSGSNKNWSSPIFYIDRILAYSPPFVRKLLQNFITIKLRHKPRFSRELEIQLWNQLKDDVEIVEDIIGKKMSIWRNKYEGST